MQTAPINREAALPVISEKYATQRARETMGEKFAAKHKAISVVVAFTNSQLTVLEQVVNKLLIATQPLPSSGIVFNLDEFSASARQLAALSISIRRPSQVEHWPGLSLPELGAIQVVAGTPLPSRAQSIRAVTLTWRDPTWVIDFFVPVALSFSNSTTASSEAAKAKGAKETALRKKMARAQKLKLAQEEAKRARAARDAARRADPLYQLEKYRKAQKAKNRKLAMEKGLIAGKRDPAAGSQILRAKTKVVQGGLPGLGKRR